MSSRENFVKRELEKIYNMLNFINENCPYSMLEDDKRFAKIFELLFEINEKANLFSCKRKLSNYLNKRKPSFFKEIQKKTSVKILKDFEKELRTKIRDELDLEKKN